MHMQPMRNDHERSGFVTADPEHSVVQGELAELRRRLDVAYTRVEGGLALLTHRTEETSKELDELSSRLVSLEHARWPLPSIAAVTAVGALVVTVWQAVH
jgi:hypothetical protein